MSTGNRASSSSARGGGGDGRQTFANAALRKAGLVDEDVGMREARSGPNRRERGRAGGAASGGANGANGRSSSSAGPSSGSRSNARDRVNPMGHRPARPTRGGGSSSSGAGVSGGADRPPGSFAKRGRVPGGGGSGSSALREPASTANSERFQTGGTVDTLRKFLASRWNPQANFMNLNSWRADPILQEKGLKPPGVPGAHKDVSTVIWKLCSEQYPEMMTLSLCHNEIRNVGIVAALPQYLPNLRNISLEGNDLKWTKDLSSWAQPTKKTSRFKELHELVLQNNPVHSNAVAASNEQDYRYEVIAKFPELRMLDGKPVSAEETQVAKLPAAQRAAIVASNAVAALGAPKNFAVQNRPGFSDEGSGAITPTFLHKFFTAFDDQRDNLRLVYNNNARFTISINLHVAPRARAKGFIHTMPNQKKLGDNWTNHGTRNVMRQSKAGASKHIRTGPTEILGLFRHLPRTTHPLTDPTKFIVDAWVIPNDVAGATATSGNPPVATKPDAMLFINVHGEFSEAPSQGVRSFDRTFLVAPAAPNSPAATAGWPCVVISEQLNIRHYSGTDAWALDALPVGDVAPVTAGTPSAAAAVTSNPVLAALPSHLQTQAPEAGLTEQQHILSLQFAAQTRLTYPFAVQCLNSNAWDGEKAMAVFHNLQSGGQIPAEAFYGGAAPA